MWRLQQTIMAISDRYFDHHPILFHEHASELNDQIQELEQLTKLYNSLKGKLPVWTEIDITTLACSVREQATEKVAESVAIAKSRTLQDYGEGEAAWKIVLPHMLAQFEKPGA